ncbi:EAL domain-containing protein [Thalassotalea castellviae]|uniref:EAL domain-containing protein n=1 Tax=Thalassotalea castellviae TaxID=3075612 RepID=A0ABU3A4U5_9GAMM|nr:EAL domain-containing protein [Thalassotalea sp. W431]MDT0605197.1 EAL domain-containing protein [Thalassotalea sp. W431]
MNIVDSHLTVNKKIISKRENRFPVIEWSLNITTQQFSYDQHAFRSVFQYSQPIVTVSELMTLLTYEMREKAKQVFRSVLTTGKSQHFTCCLMFSSEEFVYVVFTLNLAKANVVKGTMQPLMKFANHMEIANIFQSLFENEHHGILLTDSESKILVCNSYFEKQMGVKRGELIGKHTRSFNAGRHSEEFYQNMWSKIHNDGHWSGVILNRHPNGEVFPHELTIQKISPVKDKIFYLGLTVDLKQQLSRLMDTELGGIDLLTKQPTKEKFLTELSMFCQKTGHHSGKIVLVVKPKFTEENFHQNLVELSDSLFHVRLAQVTGYLEKGVFAICTEYHFEHNNEQSRAIRSAIRYLFQDIKFHASKAIHEALVKGKIGVSVLGLDSQSPEELLSNSTEAMVEGHAGEGKHLNFYFKSIHDEINRKKQLELFVSDVIKKKLLSVHYQPIVNCKTGELVKFEALCRFPKSPVTKANIEEMITIAEDIDLIADLDHCISTNALKDLNKLHEKYGEQIGLTINCSLNTKQDITEVLAKLAQQILAYVHTPGQITIELTESAYFDSQYKQSNILNDLHKIGVNIAIDDFGTGYSSFSYLTGGLFNILKIDKIFVTDIHQDRNKYNIVKMITGLSHTLGVKVIAEGVENEDELFVLQTLQVDYIQGYLFAKPKALSDLDHPDYFVKKFNQVMQLNNNNNQLERFSSIIKTQIDKLLPNDHLVKTYDYFNQNPKHVLPVIFKKKCLGLVSVSEINLHISPTMGTDAETTQESKKWKKPISQLMNVEFTKLLNTIVVDNLAALIKDNPNFPWVIVDDKEHFVGMIFKTDIFNYLIEENSQ